ncbi:MAG TPA: hypothetical protein VNG31_01585 [Candidatus Baltobacteraceae bacterium]|nr:hypothetical protein [Candidatus Baltobacteraceae bacterium]
MLALSHLVQGLVVTHLALLVFFSIGSAAFPWCDWESEFTNAPRLMTRVVITCALGLSIVGLGLFALGLLGWLTVAGICVMLALLFAAACAAWRSSPLRATFWQTRWRVLTHCWNWPLATIYVALIVIGSRAIIPDATGYSDAIYYHLAYAQDWANAHRLYVDPFLFFPFYANNFVLLYAGWIVLGAGAVVQFMTWLTGLLMALMVYAAITDYAQRRSTPLWRNVIGLLAVASVISSAIFLDYAVLGYIDIPIGAMALFAIVAIGVALADRQPGWLVVSAVIAGFLVGMKASYIVLVPVFAIVLIWGAIVLGVRAKRIAAIVALLCVVAAPWYVRNLIEAGDPIPPTLNMMLYGHDGLWMNSEWDGIWSDMRTSKNPRALVTLPVRAFLNPTSGDFREYGASGLILFLYVPVLVAIAALIYRRRLDPYLAIVIFVLTMFTAYWFVTSSLLRYALLLYPLLAVCIGIFLLELIDWRPRLAPLALLLAVVTAMPNFWDSKNIKEFTRNDVLGDLHIVLHYPGDTKYLEENDDGFVDAQVAMAWMKSHGYAGKVYVISDNAFDYYFRRAGVTSVGTWVGPAGYFRLLQAIDAGEAPEFLGMLGTHAVLYSPQLMIDKNLEHLLARQLAAAGYRAVPLDSDDGYHLYVRG